MQSSTQATNIYCFLCREGLAKDKVVI